MKRKICIVLFILLVALNVYDIYSTHTLIDSGAGFYELNPFMRFFMDRLGSLGWMILFKGAVLLWISTFLFRAEAERMWNALLVGLLTACAWYGAGAYFLNYKAMLFLEGLT